MNKNLFQDWDYENLQKHLTHMGKISSKHDTDHFNIFSKNFLLNINKDNYFDEDIYLELETSNFRIKKVFTQPYWGAADNFIPQDITRLDKDNQQDFICHNNDFSDYVPKFCNLTHLNKLSMYDIILSEFNGKKIDILKAIVSKKLNFISLNTIDLVKNLNNPPVIIKVDCLLEEVIKIEEEFTNAGATVLIREHSIEVKDKTLCFGLYDTLRFNRFKNIAQEYKQLTTDRVFNSDSILECEALNGNYYVYEILANQDVGDYINQGNRVGLYISQNKNLDQMP